MLNGNRYSELTESEKRESKLVDELVTFDTNTSYKYITLAVSEDGDITLTVNNPEHDTKTIMVESMDKYKSSLIIAVKYLALTMSIKSELNYGCVDVSIGIKYLYSRKHLLSRYIYQVAGMGGMYNDCSVYVAYSKYSINGIKQDDAMARYGNVDYCQNQQQNILLNIGKYTGIVPEIEFIISDTEHICRSMNIRYDGETIVC